MLCPNCHTDHAPGDLYDGDLCRDCALDAGIAHLSAELGVPAAVVAARAASVGRTPRGAGSRTAVETFEERDERLADLPGGRRASTPWVAGDVLRRLDRAADTRGQSTIPECPVCRRRFRSGRDDRVTCSGHCRDLARRIRQGDPTAEQSVRMLFAPPACAGCGEPLWAKRPDAKHHGPACVKRAQRARARQAG